MPKGVSKSPRPEPVIHRDLDTRSFPLGRGSVRTWMLEIDLGLPIGIYGTGKYGRCRYGVIIGLYGLDRYGECVYH